MRLVRRAARHRSLPLLIVGLLVVACGAPAITASPSPSLVAVATPSPSPGPTLTPLASPSSTPSASPSPVPSIVPAALSGVMVDRKLADRLPLAVMIDDARAARPQSGFNAASLVYQSPADGYETRYMMVFQEGDAKAVGPVRSARFFLVQWASEVEAALSHYGGDQRSRTYIKYHPKYFTDVDALGRGSSAYHRVKTRKKPHNGYTSTKELRRVALKLGAPKTMDTDLFRRPFRDPSALADRGAAGEWLRVPYWTNTISYRYHRANNEYRRSVDGKAQIDPADGKRVTATNVVVLFQKFRIDTKVEPGHARPVITTLGRGKALVYQEGRVIKATWRKVNDTGPTRLFDSEGDEILLVRGRTFFQVVPPGTKVTDSD